ncbi:hypothetical protein [Caulobacter sp. UC70_42]|uniref:hypothetical protein n=1 Tax=Caulobacter sp. UC70_42 TaxID=3374551 RepID=UPI00375757D9
MVPFWRVTYPPCVLWVFVAAPLIERLEHAKRFITGLLLFRFHIGVIKTLAACVVVALVLHGLGA